MAWLSTVAFVLAQAKAPLEAAPVEGLTPVQNLFIAVALIVGSMVAGNLIARSLRMPDYAFKIALILFTLSSSLTICFLGGPPKRGIDLSGGVVLVYEVDRSTSQASWIPDAIERLNEALGAGGGERLEAVPAGPEQIEIAVPEGVDKARVERAVAKLKDGDLELKPVGKPRIDAGKTVYVFTADQKQRTVDMNKLIAAVGRRINPSGVKELTIRQYGKEQLEVIVPEIEKREVEQIKRRISTSGLLEFRIVANDTDDKEIIRASAKSPGRDVYVGGKLLGRWVKAAPDLDIRDATTRQSESQGRELLIRVDPYDVDGRYLTHARSDFDQSNALAVSFSFDNTGAGKFGELTSRNLPDTANGFHRRLGIILDNEMISAPTINSAIHGNGQISGNFNQEQVDFLVGVLNAGSLPASLRPEPLSERQISSQLGDDTIRKGTMSMAISTIAILIFMAVYYRFCGLVADIAVSLNILVTVALMIMIHAAFTLPGLAGLVLTVGMAVDANVLIYERMREESERGASLRMAIRNGFGRAMATIIDSHMTTMTTGIVLYIIGTDQIRGFAVTLVLGLVMSLYTAVFVSRVIVDIAERKRWLTKINMMHVIGHTNIDFIRWRGTAIIVSLGIIVIGLIATAMRGSELLDIDFTGGSSVQVLFKNDKAQDIADVREKLSHLEDVAVSSVGETGKNLEYKVDTSERDISKVKQDIQKAFGDSLATYQMTFEDLTPIEAAKAVDETPKDTEAEKPDAPAGENTTSALDRSNSSWVISKLAPRALVTALFLSQVAPVEATQPPAETPPPAAVTETPAENAAPAQSSPPVEATPETPPTAVSVAPAANPADVNAPDPSQSPLATGSMLGGTRVKLNFPEPISYPPLRDMIESELKELNQTDVIFELRNPKYQPGSDQGYNDWTLETSLAPEPTKDLLGKIQTRLAATPVFPSSNQIGGKVAGDTQLIALYALLASMAIIVVYIWVRFQNVIFGIGAIVALVHDVFITTGFLALSYYLSPYMGAILIDPFKISLSVVAALLTIVGFSINDTIVVFDRIREVRGKSPELTPKMINDSVNQTLSRTILTSGTVLIASVILYFIGGPGIHAFAYCMVVGVIAGTFSSIYIAAPILLWLKRPSQAGSKLGGPVTASAAKK